MHTSAARKGLTMIETLLGVVLLLSGATAFLWGMQSWTLHADYISEYQVAMNAAQGQLEALAATPFNTLWTDAQFDAARPPNTGLLMCVGEDANCNGLLEPGEDANANGLLDSVRLGVQIQSADTIDPPDLLNLHVAACWVSRGRSIGEDRNCNGQLDAGEDADLDGWLDSPAMVSTRIARR